MLKTIQNFRGSTSPDSTQTLVIYQTKKIVF